MQTKHDDNIRWPQNGQIMSARAEKKKFLCGCWMQNDEKKNVRSYCKNIHENSVEKFIMRIGKPAKKSRVSNKDSALNWILEIIWIKLHVALLFTLFCHRPCKIFSFVFPNQIITLGRFCWLSSFFLNSKMMHLFN